MRVGLIITTSYMLLSITSALGMTTKQRIESNKNKINNSSRIEEQMTNTSNNVVSNSTKGILVEPNTPVWQVNKWAVIFTGYYITSRTMGFVLNQLEQYKQLDCVNAICPSQTVAEIENYVGTILGTLATVGWATSASRVANLDSSLPTKRQTSDYSILDTLMKDHMIKSLHQSEIVYAEPKLWKNTTHTREIQSYGIYNNKGAHYAVKTFKTDGGLIGYHFKRINDTRLVKRALGGGITTWNIPSAFDGEGEGFKLEVYYYNDPAFSQSTYQNIGFAIADDAINAHTNANYLEYELSYALDQIWGEYCIIAEAASFGTSWEAICS